MTETAATNGHDTTVSALASPVYPSLEGTLWKPRKLKKIVMVGMGNSLIGWFNENYRQPWVWDTPGEEVWALNTIGLLGRCDVMFDIHELNVPDPKWGAYPQELEKAGKAGLFKELMLMEKWKGHNFEKVYPLAEVIDKTKENYFVTTPAYMLALASLCEVEQILLYGFDYSYSNIQAYEAGKPCCEYWLGWHRARGVDIRVPMGHTLLDMHIRMQTPCYGYGKKQPILERQPDSTVKVIGFQGQEPKPEEMEKIMADPGLPGNAPAPLTVEAPTQPELPLV